MPHMTMNKKTGIMLALVASSLVLQACGPKRKDVKDMTPDDVKYVPASPIHVFDVNYETGEVEHTRIDPGVDVETTITETYAEKQGRQGYTIPAGTKKEWGKFKMSADGSTRCQEGKEVPVPAQTYPATPGGLVRTGVTVETKTTPRAGGWAIAGMAYHTDAFAPEVLGIAQQIVGKGDLHKLRLTPVSTNSRFSQIGGVVGDALRGISETILGIAALDALTRVGSGGGSNDATFNNNPIANATSSSESCSTSKVTIKGGKAPRHRPAPCPK